MPVSAEMPIGLVLADPHPVMLDGMQTDFEHSSDFKILATVNDGDSALRAIHQYEPDCIVLDLPLIKRSGLALIQEIQAQKIKTRPIVFTSSPIGDVMRAIDFGVKGLVSKTKSIQVLQRCIRSVHEGQTWLDRDLTEKTMTMLLDREKRKSHAARLLTPREIDVARMVTEGWPNKKIATKLDISEGTAKLHLHHIYQKLNCPGRMGLMLYMQQNGLN